MAEDEYDSTASAIGRAQQSGSMWLNSVFRFRDTPRRLFGKRGPRISKLEAFWGAICMLLVAAFLILGFVYIGDWGPFFLIFHPVAIAGWSLLAFWNGRKIAHMSPLRRRTGEGTGVYMVILIKKLIVKISFIFQRPVMYNQCISRAGRNDRELEVVECIDWIGTARAPRMPFNYDPFRHADLQQEGDALMNQVDLQPRGVDVPKTDRQRQRILREIESAK